MSKRNHKRYSDKFRGSAVVMLEAQGYPDKKGALKAVSEHLAVPPSTLAGWYKSYQNPSVANFRDEKRGDLAALIEAELSGIFDEMPDARKDASYRDLATAAGILIDKKQLLSGKATERTEIIDGSDARERIRGAITRLSERSGEREDNSLPQ